MSLDNLKTTWKYYKKQSDLPAMQPDDILAIIQSTSTNPSIRLQSLFLNMALLLLLVLTCKGG